MRGKKSLSEKKVLTKQLIEESDDDDDEVISNAGAIIPLTIPQSRMMKWRLKVLMIISGMLFYFAINLHTFLVEQVACFINELATFQSHPVSIRNLRYKPQIIVAKNSLLDVFES